MGTADERSAAILSAETRAEVRGKSSSPLCPQWLSGRVFEYPPSPQFNRYSVPSQAYPVRYSRSPSSLLIASCLQYASPALHQANNGVSAIGGDLSPGEILDRGALHKLAAPKPAEGKPWRSCCKVIKVSSVAGRVVAEMYHSKEESRTHRDGKDELVEELNSLLSFVKSGFTSSNQQDSSQFLKVPQLSPSSELTSLQSNAPGAEILRELYREGDATDLPILLLLADHRHLLCLHLLFHHGHSPIAIRDCMFQSRR